MPKATATLIDAARLAAALASAALAPLAVLAPREDPLRRFAIGAGEWGQFIALPALAALLPGGPDTLARRVARLLAVPAALLALDPVLRAWPLAARLPQQLAAAFGTVAPRELPGAPARPRPLVARDLFRGIRAPLLKPEKLVYVERPDKSLSLDFYRPPAVAPPAPCVVVIHGGSWANGDSTQLGPLNYYLAARGYAVAAINYRLAPAHTFPAQLDDVLAAVDYLKNNAESLGIDADRLALLGRSAGGQLALLAAYSRPDPAVRGVIAYYAPIEMRGSVIDPFDPSKTYDEGPIPRYIGGSLAAVPELYDRATPLNYVGPASPPTLLMHGGRDRLVWPIHSALLDHALAAAGRPHFYLRLPWASHGCDFYFGGPSSQISTYAVERFLAAIMV